MNERMPMSRIGGVGLDRTVSDVERKLRIELAAAFRVAHHLGWNVDTLNHVSLRIPGTDTFLMNPQGLGWDEITASSLATLDHDWNVLSHSGIKPQPAGYNFHSGILMARPDVHCVFHVHETASQVIGALEEKLVILSQGGCRLYQEVGYHGRLRAESLPRPGHQRRRRRHAPELDRRHGSQITRPCGQGAEEVLIVQWNTAERRDLLALDDVESLLRIPSSSQNQLRPARDRDE
jgi:ribulose-5-phosphate 4-epimerase/fuculose-1-phosphate aldolase